MGKRLDEYGVFINSYETGDKDVGSATYEGAVEALLQDVAQTATGRAVFYKIKAHGTVMIKPWRNEKDRCNADSKVASKEVKGFGAVVEVGFSPHTWAATSSCRNGPGSRGDEVLIHELLHGARALGKDYRDVPLHGTMAKYTSEEEFFAILVENIYVSESGRQAVMATATTNSNLRANHRGARQHLQGVMADSVVFLSVPEHLQLVAKFCKQHTEVAPMLAQVNARFNPVKWYYALY